MPKAARLQEAAAPKKKRASKSSARAGLNSLATVGDRTPLPEELKPQLATLVDSPPGNSDDWLFEIKFDGYRLLARVDGGKVTLLTRNSNNWTSRMPALAEALGKTDWPDGWYDGEIVVPNAQGLPDFQALQNAFDNSRTKDIVYFAFDVLFLDGYDLRGAPLSERRKVLEALFDRDIPDNVRLSEVLSGDTDSLLASACKMGLEGLIGKRKSSIYGTRRSPDWIKLKCTQRQEFVIGGYTDPQGSRSGLGALLVGVYDDSGGLRYAGKVGTGFTQKTLGEVKRQLDALHSDKNPFTHSTGIDRKAHWVKPILLAEVSFGEWTQDGHIRHSAFHGLRTDKPATNIVREIATHTPDGRRRKR